MNLYRMFPTLCVTGLLVSGCFEDNIYENIGTLEPEASEFVFEADNYDLSPIEKNISVSSNRSWSVLVEEGCDWLETGIDGFENLSGARCGASLPIRLSNNRLEQERSASITFFSEDGKKSITIRQKAIVPRLVIEGSHAVGGLSSKGDTVRLSVNSNVEWTASVKPGGTAQMELDTQEGSLCGNVLVTLAENFNTSGGADGTVVFSAEGCPDVEVLLSQMTAAKYFQIDPCSTRIDPDAESFTIPIRTNCDWNAEVVSQTYFGSFSLSADHGVYTDKSVVCNFTINDNPSEERIATVRFSAEGIEPQEITLTQSGYLHIVFHTGSGMNKDGWPFVDPAYSTIPSKGDYAVFGGKDAEFVLKNGYVLIIHGTTGIHRNSGTGLNVIGVAGDYIKFPVVRGKRLTTVGYTTRASSKSSVTLMDESLTVPFAESVEVIGQGKRFEWVLEASEPDKVYALRLDSGKFQIGTIDLFYE